MQDAKEEVRARLAIEDVIGEYVQLKRAGRNFKGLSPFTNERTPSFTVSPEKQIWHDFSSGKGGDIFSFIMDVEGLDFRQALEQLARRAGVDLSMYQSSRDGRVTKQKQRMREAHSLAARYYQQSLLQNQHAVEYVFKKRALSKEVVTEFQIGYSPNSADAAVRFLEGRNFSKSEIKLAGLTNRFGGDLFRGRMMVPLMDGGGQVIGFTARQINDEPNAPKYLNTPQTLLYDKGRHVFGLSQAKEAIRKAGFSVVVEGNLDVVSSHQVGVKHVVATAGTALTEHHLKALVRLGPQIRLAFDGDKAGLAATERAIPIAESVGAELKIVSLPEGVGDPDELIQQGVEKWQAAIDAARPVLDWLLAQYEQREDLTTAAGKRNYTDAAVGVLRTLKDPVVQDHYIQLMSERTGASVESLRTKLSQQPTKPAPQRAKKPVSEAAKTAEISQMERLQDRAIELFVREPSVRSQLLTVPVEAFVGEARRAVVEYLKTSQEHFESTPEQLKKYDDYVTMLPEHAETRYAAWTVAERTLEAARLLRQILNKQRKHQQAVLTAQLREAEQQADDETANELRKKLNELIKEIKHG